MATSITSDTFHKFSCTPCKDDGENREAEVYCVNCKEYLCKKCLRSHNRVAEAREHQLLGKDEFQQVRTPSTNSEVPDLPTERCLRHHGKLVDMFCGDHDVVECSECMALKHRSCKDVAYIPDIAQRRVTKQSVKKVQDALSTRKHKATSIKDNRVDNQSRIVREKDGCLDEVQEREKDVQTTNIIDKFSEYNNKLENDVKSCDQIITLIDQSQRNLSTAGTKHTISQTFIHMKQTERIISKAGKQLEETGKNINDSQCLHYQIDTDINDILSSHDLLGIVHAGIPTIAGLEFVEDIKITIDSDTKQCDCADLCQLPNGTIIVTDRNNKNIKSFTYDTLYKLSDSLNMSNSPWGVCCINDNDVAVTVPGDTKVEIVTFEPKMVIKSSFMVDYSCHGIEYHNGKLYIGHHLDKKLKVYDLYGYCLQTYQTDQTGEALFSGPLRLCVIPDKQQIAVADGNKGLVMIDMSGQLVTEYTYTNRQWTSGVCIDDRGNLMLTDFDSRQTVTVGADKTCRPLLTSMDKHPKAVFYDKQTRRLFVTLYNCDFVKYFTVKYDFS